MCVATHSIGAALRQQSMPQAPSIAIGQRQQQTLLGGAPAPAQTARTLLG